LVVPPLCPGGVAIVTPPVQCPAWFKHPEPGKGLIVIQNFTKATFDVVAVIGADWNMRIDPNRTTPGILVISLDPKRYRFDVGRYGGIEFDITAGQMLVTSITDDTERNRAVYPLDVPAGC